MTTRTLYNRRSCIKLRIIYQLLILFFVYLCSYNVLCYNSFSFFYNFVNAVFWELLDMLGLSGYDDLFACYEYIKKTLAR